MQTQKRKTAAERRAHLAAWQQSQLSKSQYCAQNQINYQTFLGWTKNQSTNHSDEQQKFLPVELTPSSPSPATLVTLTFANQITLQLHKNAIKFKPGQKFMNVHIIIGFIFTT